MLVKPFVDEHLGNSSYLVASEVTGRAAVIDPQRDVDRYLQAAEGLGLRLVYALDTHLHADFVSGGRELAARPGLSFGASAEAGLGFVHLPLAEGNTIQLDDLAIGGESARTSIGVDPQWRVPVREPVGLDAHQVGWNERAPDARCTNSR